MMQPMRLQPIRQFSLKQDSNQAPKPEKDDYQSQFDDLLGDSSKKVSKEERAFIDRQE